MFSKKGDQKGLEPVVKLGEWPTTMYRTSALNMFQLYVHCVYIMSGRGSWYTSPNWVVYNLPLSIINIDNIINLK